MELTEHEKAMIAVAEGGDPNDPAENKDEVITLPSEEGAKPQEETVESPKDDGESNEETEGKGEEDVKEDVTETSDEELTEEQKELQKLRQEAKEREVYDAIGGKEAYTELAKWAGDNLTQDQLDVYNKVTEKGDTKVAVFAAQALQAMKQNAAYEKYGSQGNVTMPNGGSTEGTVGYESTAQMMVDMNDPRYKSDPAFRAKVEQKLAASPAGLI